MKSIVIIGASGHGRVLADIAHLQGYEDICFLDDNPANLECAGYPVVGSVDSFVELQGPFIVAIGNSAVRRAIMERIEAAGKELVSLIHPSAVISADAVIGAGTAVAAGAVINPNVCIGKGCIINTCSSVDHDCVLDDYVHVSVGVHVAGTVCIGSNTWLGAGAVISNNLTITTDCVIGAGAVVVKPIAESGTYIGVPARKVDL